MPEWCSRRIYTNSDTNPRKACATGGSRGAVRQGKFCSSQPMGHERIVKCPISAPIGLTDLQASDSADWLGAVWLLGEYRSVEIQASVVFTSPRLRRDCG